MNVNQKVLSIITKIISGGQTGADRAALDFAIKHNIPHGGWLPKGRQAEDGKLPKRYQLQE
ncbi:MAG: putative molybdenum carrier protein, partial [Syntrophus sp. (in: bacteria)]